MAPDDPRAATAAAIERTERDRVPPKAILHADEDRYRDSVEWDAGGASFSVHRHGEGGPDGLLAFTDDGVAAFEVDREEFREHLAAADLFEYVHEIDVRVDDLGWFGDDAVGDDGAPTRTDLERLRTDPPFEYLGEYERPGVRAVVSELRELYRVGTAIAGEFAVTDDLGRGLWREHGLEYEEGDFGLGHAFLRSDAVAEFLEDASPDDHPGEATVKEVAMEHDPRFVSSAVDRFTFERVPLERLDGRVAELLLRGGAYEDFAGDYEEAEALGTAFSHAIRDGKWHRREPPAAGSVSAYLAHYPWSNWFVYTGCWDATVLVEDFDAERIRLVLATDSD